MISPLPSILPALSLSHVHVVARATSSSQRERVHRTQIFQVIERLGAGIKYTVVEERGASIYSCSEAAAAELAAVNMVHRSAVSIGEREVTMVTTW